MLTLFCPNHPKIIEIKNDKFFISHFFVVPQKRPYDGRKTSVKPSSGTKKKSENEKFMSQGLILER